MPANLYPLLMKPGIKRDGTDYQAEYCTDGQWVRFQRGKPQKIGGMQSLTTSTGLNVSDLLAVPSGDYMLHYIASSTGIYLLEANMNFTWTGRTFDISPAGVTSDSWQSEIVSNPLGGGNNLDPQLNIVYLRTSNNRNINDNSAASLYSARFSTDDLLQPVVGLNPSCNGGICFAAPYLFAYGSNGIMQYSTANNPLDFGTGGATPGGAQIISNSGAKIIHARSIRGGTNAPSLIFWSMNEVIRVLNVGLTAAAPFKSDIIAKGVSILSPRCVIEHRGLFIWPGTDDFYIYNGIVETVGNIINKKYFFDNIDMNYRQNVFGVRVPEFNELWWFYPEKIGAPNRPTNPAPPVGTNTRAIIYNILENSWYDTAISRDVGYYSNDIGSLFTYGSTLTDPNAGYPKALFRHEVGVNETIPVVDVPSNPIVSFFKTPTISWEAFNPMKQLTGVDRWVDLQRIQPDFVMNNDIDTITLTVNSKLYAQSPEVINVRPEFTFNNTTDKINVDLQGNNLTFTFTSQGYFELGHTIIALGLGDGR